MSPSCSSCPPPAPRPHIPYRNSMMTMALKDSLGGNCRTTMIATVSGDKEQLDESISTCRFAQRITCVRNQVSRGEGEMGRAKAGKGKGSLGIGRGLVGVGREIE